MDLITLLNISCQLNYLVLGSRNWYMDLITLLNISCQLNYLVLGSRNWYMDLITLLNISCQLNYVLVGAVVTPQYGLNQYRRKTNDQIQDQLLAKV
jgi:hypothetical protein